METKKKFRVLVVDDTISEIETLMGLLQNDYMVIAATNGQRALSLANKQPQPDMILLDVDMPEMDGFEVCRTLKENRATREIPIVFMTTDNGQQTDYSGLEMGAIDYLTKPFNPSLVKVRVANALNLASLQISASQIADDATARVHQTQTVLLETLGKLVDYRRSKTSAHIKRTQLYVKTVAEALLAASSDDSRLNQNTVEHLYHSTPLYDIGMVGIRDNIVLTPKSLSDDEFKKVKQHATLGQQLLQEVESTLGRDPIIEMAQEMALCHHERWDGSGYPQGLKGESIPLSARIMAIADVYDALISKRVYQQPITHLQAVEIIKNGAGTQFDPELVEVFLKVAPTLRDIALVYAEHDEEREALQQTMPDHRARTIRRILVVEDNDIMRTVVQSQFETMDFVVSVAANGKDAMDLINQPNFYDLIVTDINMPVMSGYDLLKSIQALGLTTPVVAMTASDLELTQDKAIELGFSACLLKPFDDTSINEVIAAITDVK
ncbi:response regulator [Vibrio hippocampi]|uniref:Sensor histidine kinase RcsC n=1 Tax=Vibrio hippocampi TaxID=654686 RepID=A0ABM8ZMP9_9VIBR|nr:response regulator [Vibrio hippocampi]CAH0529784.1 Sensor histidine kinase RcsC [Vibrio hippocampi]